MTPAHSSKLTLYEQFNNPCRKAKKENVVNKNLLAITMALLLLMTAAASAQTVHMRAKVPFNFIVSGATLPAGEYEIQSLGAGQTLLVIRNLNSSAGTLVISSSRESLDASPRTKLVFHRYGDRYFLAELWQEGHNVSREVTPSSRETEVAMDFTRTDVVLLMARR
jgi:hypothetical protein